MNENIQIIQNLVDWINNNPEQIQSVAEASQEVNYSRSHLSRLFKKTTGITYQEYATAIKMGFAGAELRDTEKPVQEIAATLGYSDPVSFNHAFANAYGCSPTEFRKNPYNKPVLFYKIISTPNESKGVVTMKKLNPVNIIGDNFLKLLELQPPAIILYCFLASFSVSPTGMLKDYNPKGNTVPCISISPSVARDLPFSIDEFFLALYELADFDLLTIVNMVNDEIYVTLNPIPEELVSNGFLKDFTEFVMANQAIEVR